MSALHAVVGHEEARASIAAAMARDALPAALLLHGPPGVGKQRLAQWIAQLHVCEDRQGAGPCGACRSCRMTLVLEHPDVHWYFPVERPKGASGDRLTDVLEDVRIQGLAERREQPLRPSWSDELRGLYLGVVMNIRKRARLRPSMAPGQVFIVGDAEMLVPQESSPEAANALLKLLEEPQGDSRYILTSSEPGRLLATIRSRTVSFHVGPVQEQLVIDFLMEHRSVTRDQAEKAARLGRGSIGRSLGFLPDGDDRGPLELLRRAAYQIVVAATGDSYAPGYRLALLQSLTRARNMVDLFLFVDEWLRDLAAVVAGAGDLAFNQDAVPGLRTLISEAGLTGPDLARALSAVERARVLARGNVHPQLVLSGLIRDLRRACRPLRQAEFAS